MLPRTVRTCNQACADLEARKPESVNDVPSEPMSGSVAHLVVDVCQHAVGDARA